MRIVKTQDALEELVAEYRQSPFVTVDTEFMRERTYWPILCLIQVARPAVPGDDADEERAAAIIDPIDSDLDLAPLLDLMADPSVVKVFHAARQDVEIFHKLSGHPPTPLYDTQIAAMVFGFGDQVGYETLVRKIAQAGLDKSSRFTDWSARPLSEKQLNYAIGDVTYLRDIYLALSSQIEEAGRERWVAEEMAVLASPSTYEVVPEETWRRLKTRTNNGRFLAVAKELAAWREREAQSRDMPRNRIMKDDALLEICANQPKSLAELQKSRLLFREGRKPEIAEAILAAVDRGLKTPKDQQPVVSAEKPPKPGSPAISELLRVLLKARSDEIGVAQRLLASSAELDRLASDEPEGVPALAGWRREAFGDDALRLKRGEIALAVGKGGVRIVAID